MRASARTSVLAVIALGLAGCLGLGGGTGVTTAPAAVTVDVVPGETVTVELAMDSATGGDTDVYVRGVPDWLHVAGDLVACSAPPEPHDGASSFRWTCTVRITADDDAAGVGTVELEAEYDPGRTWRTGTPRRRSRSVSSHRARLRRRPTGPTCRAR